MRKLAEGPYAGFNHTHLKEILADREGIHLSRSAVGRTLLAMACRAPAAAELPGDTLFDGRAIPARGCCYGSMGIGTTGWRAEERTLTLAGAVDDATSSVPFALFRQQEDARSC